MSSIHADRVSSLLSTVDHHGTSGRRLVDNSSRLCSMVHQLLSLNLIPAPSDTSALELACSALQLTLRHPQPTRSPMTLRDRAQTAVELLVSAIPADEDTDGSLSRATLLLQQLPTRSPVLPEARLLADAVNLEDFGITGLLSLFTSLVMTGDGISQFLDACTTREHYGYFDARLARFHYEPARQLALQRLANARQCCAMLRAELPTQPHPS